MPDDEPPLTVKEAATWLKCSPSTVYAMASAGKLQFFRVGTGRGSIRITKSALLALAEESGKPSATQIMLAMLSNIDKPKQKTRKSNRTK